MRFKLFLILLFVFTFDVSQSLGKDLIDKAEQKKSIGEFFSGEKLTYQLGFMMFDNAAIGEVSVEPAKVSGEYYIRLKAQTAGFIGWLLKSRRDEYVAHVYEVDGGTRFRTKSFKKDVVIGKKRGSNGHRKNRNTVEEIDYENMVVRWSKFKNGKLRRRGETPIPEGKIFDCPLTVFFNLRHGVYGNLDEGKRLKIDTLPKKGYTEILIDVYNKKKMVKAGYVNSSGNVMARVNLDKDLFGSMSGIVDVLFDKDLIAVEAVAKDIMLMGDVRGKLINRVKPGLTQN